MKSQKMEEEEVVVATEDEEYLAILALVILQK